MALFQNGLVWRWKFANLGFSGQWSDSLAQTVDWGVIVNVSGDDTSRWFPLAASRLSPVCHPLLSTLTHCYPLLSIANQCQPTIGPFPGFLAARCGPPTSQPIDLPLAAFVSKNSFNLLESHLLNEYCNYSIIAISILIKMANISSQMITIQ